MKIKKPTQHLNYYNSKNQIYCRKENKVMIQNSGKCNECDYCYGSLQGKGVECMWEDISEYPIVTVENPNMEYNRVDQLIKNKKLC